MPTPPNHASVQLGRFRLPLTDQTPKNARDLAASMAHAWELESIAEQVRLAVSEVVTNAFLHAGTALYASVIVEIARIDTAFHLTVHDGSKALPTPREAADADETGRGLVLLEAMTDNFGWYATPFGKAVWFSVKVTWPSDL